MFNLERSNETKGVPTSKTKLITKKLFFDSAKQSVKLGLLTSVVINVGLLH